MREGLTFYRCILCGHVVSFWDIRKGGCQYCGQSKIRPVNITLWEKIVQILKHPIVWKWPSDNDL